MNTNADAGRGIDFKHTSSILPPENTGDRDSGETRKPNNQSRRLCQAFKTLE